MCGHTAIPAFPCDSSMAHGCCYRDLLLWLQVILGLVCVAKSDSAADALLKASAAFLNYNKSAPFIISSNVVEVDWSEVRCSKP